MLQRIVGNGKCRSMYLSGVPNFKNQNFETKAHTVNIKKKHGEFKSFTRSILINLGMYFSYQFSFLSVLVGEIFFLR